MASNGDSGPGTHALIVGVGDYPLAEGMSLPGVVAGAETLLDWLGTKYRNPGAPLSSVELLLSGPGVNARGDPHSRIERARPTFEIFRAAVLHWKARMESDPGNIGVFYFAGHGAIPAGDKLSDTLLMLDDFAPETGDAVVSFLGIAAAMQNCPARQLYLIDTSRASVPNLSPRPLLSLPANIDAPPRRAILYATGPGGQAYDRPDEPSPFLDTILTALRVLPSPSGGGLTPGHIADYANALLAARSDQKIPVPQRVATDIVENFEFHYPIIERRPSAPTAAVPRGSGSVDRHPPSSSRAPPKRTPPSASPPPPPVNESPRTGAVQNPPSPRRPMDKSQMAAALHEKAAWLPDKRVKLDFGLRGVVILDGIERRVTEEDGPADTTIIVDWEDWEAMSDGTLDGMTAFMAGKVKVTGDMSNAMQLQGMLNKLRDPNAEPAPAPRSRRRTVKAPEAGSESRPPKTSTRSKQAEDEAPVALPEPPPPPPPPTDESATEFVADDAETERDELGRSVLAIGLARRLHRIWRRANENAASAGADDERAAFVVHLDSPWGGGKTSFANYLARVLDPVPAGREPAAFLKERYGDSDLGGIFLDDPPADAAAAERLAKLPADSRRPWIVVPFNAWQVEHCAPPWWVFYQTIRKGCFAALRRDGDLPWRPGEGRPRLRWLQRMDVSAKLWLREIGWRLTNPKVRSLLLTAAISFLLLLLLQRFGIWGLTGGKEPKTGFLLTSGFGLALGGVTTITFLWGLGALFTESIVPGTDTLAERLSLGSGDPFDRFRRHFARTMARVRRPVMVVVDDLDRCRPDFVVGLVRGMQTLLRSPRVVFVILGDRDWIERAFESHHKAMEKVDVGPEQTFGARFVEKAIQMSFILPAMGEDGRTAYVRRVLLGAAPQPVRESGSGLDADTARTVREVVNRETAAPDSDPFDTGRIVTRALSEVASRPEASASDEAALQQQVERLVGETLAINATSSERVEQAVAHQLEALAAHFPANPRQIKRIVNAITVYYAVALQRPGLDPDERFRTQLALWIIIMTEWPETWRLLASFPALVRILQSDDPMAALKAPATDLPGSPEATAGVVRRILADMDLMALIKGRGSEPLDPERIALLAQLTPLHSRKRRLSERNAEEPAKAGEAAP